MRSEGLLAYDFEEESGKSVVTGFAGLLPYLDLACVLDVAGSVDRNVGICGEQGWLDRQHVLSLLLLNVAGGDCVDDIRVLEADAGLCEVFRQAERHGLSREERRKLERRFRRGRGRTFPSETRLREYLDAFHNEAEEGKRVQGEAFIPAKNAALCGLDAVNRDVVASVCRHRRPAQMEEATLDIDATLQETGKKDALYCYKGFAAYQPLSALWSETGLVVGSEFRDGNVPAGWQILRFLRESLAALPECVERVRVRMDSAGYQHDVLRFMATGDAGRRAVIDFTVSCDMTPEFRGIVKEVPQAQWQPLVRSERGKCVRTNLEWAEVVFVPNATATGKHAPYRYLAIREPLDQGVLDLADDEGQLALAFPTIVCAGRAYRLSGIVTNREGDAADLIHWHHGRCGKGEEIHAIMKTDFAGGRFPSDKFGANAAWWEIVVLATNLHAAMRLLVFPDELRPKRMKALRFALIQVPARLVEHSRQIFLRLARGHPAFELLTSIRAAIGKLAPACAT